MPIIEAIAVIFSFLSIWFSINKSKFLWPVGIISIISYLILFYNNGLYVNFYLQVILLIQSFYGWQYWKGKRGIEPPITRLKEGDIVTYISMVIITTYILTIFLISYTNDIFSFFDALCITIGITAMSLLIKKRMENWAWWMIADIVYIIFFIQKDLYLFSVLYIIFFIMSIFGYIEWRKEFIKQISI